MMFMLTVWLCLNPDSVCLSNKEHHFLPADPPLLQVISVFTIKKAMMKPRSFTVPKVYIAQDWQIYRNSSILRILASYEGKTAKNQQLLDILACNSANSP